MTNDDPLLAESLDIAVIGLAIRAPGAANAVAFWDRLVNGVESISRLTEEDLRAAGVHPSVSADPRYVPAAALLDDVDQFDATLFGYSPKEAAMTDPQIRLGLEVAWEAFEDAACDPRRYPGAIGVFAAASFNTYLFNNLRGQMNLTDFFLANDNLSRVVASGQEFLATRIGYKLGLHGPCLNVQCACSGSLVAVHLARQSLLSRECDMVLAGGSSIYLPQRAGYVARDGLILSRDGHCRPFDAAATGTIFGRGVGFVVLKRLSDAAADGDRIYAVLKGSAVNNDGDSKVGFTAPGVDGQAAAIAEALADADISPDTVGYIEAHGTGTEQGDPIEIAALSQAFRTRTDRIGFCAVGSVKGNIGHLDVVSGIVGFIKTVLTVHHGEIPPSINFSRPNPAIDFATSPFYVNTTRRRWDSTGASLRRAGVSAFGMGGTNAHVVVEEAPAGAGPGAASGRTREVLTLSGKSEAAVTALAARYAPVVEAGGAALADVCFTAHVGRAALGHRVALVAETAAGLASQLRAVAAGTAAGGVARGEVRSGRRPRVAWLFTGQGAQYAGMGAELYASAPPFRAAMDRCAAALAGTLEVPLLEVLYGSAGGRLTETAYAQPALFAVQMGLAALWQAWGVSPGAVLGHSVGEFAAACVAGVLDVAPAARLVAARGRLMQELPAAGAMAAVWAPDAVVRAALSDGVTIAAVNGPATVVVAGGVAAVATVCGRLAARGVRTERLAVGHAFHTRHMTPMVAAFGAVAGTLAPAGAAGPGPIPWVSTVTGTWGDASTGTAAYWTAQIEAPVQYERGLATLVAAGYDAFVEIGPAPTLVGLGRASWPAVDAVWGASLRPGHDGWATLLETVGALWVRGAAIDWAGFDGGARRQRVALPTYPFQRQRFWIEAAPPTPHAADSTPGLALRELRSPAIAARIFESTVSPKTPAFLADHCIDGHAVLPLTGTLSLILGAASAIGAPAIIERFSLHRAVRLSDEQSTTLQIVVTPSPGDHSAFEIFTAGTSASAPGPWVKCGAGQLCSSRGGVRLAVAAGGVDAIQDRLTALDPTAYYAQLAEAGLEYGAAFQGIDRLWHRHGEALARIVCPDAIAGEISQLTFHPAFVDAFLQAVFAASGDFLASNDALYLPVGLDRLELLGPLADAQWSHVIVDEPADGLSASASVRLIDGDGQVRAAFSGVRLQRISRREFARTDAHALDDLLYAIEWRRADLARAAAGPARLVAADRDARAASEVVEDVRRRCRLEQYSRLQPILDDHCVRYVAAAMTALGWPTASEAAASATGLAERLGVRPQFHRMFGRMLEMLTEDGVLTIASGEWRATNLPGPVPAATHRDLLRDFPDCAAELTMVDRCGRALADVLRGDQDPLALLFPGGSLAELERIYKDSPFARAYNSVVLRIVREAVEGSPAARSLRLLEIGAGTGGTASSLIPAVAGRCAEYVFTDVSPAFLAKARARFGSHPFVSYRLLDIDRDPQEQGFPAATYDVIVASNVLHATADLEKTIGHVRSLLRPGGALVLVEGIAKQRWVDVIFGLTDGWWKFNDHHRRRSYPLVDLPQWKTLLTGHGFEDVNSYPGETESDRLYHQAVICATAPLVPSANGRQDAGDWLVFEDATGSGSVLSERLQLRGGRCTVVRDDDRYEYAGGANASLRAGEPADFRRLLAEVPCVSQANSHIVFLWGLDDPSAGQPSLAQLSEAQRRSLGGALSLVQALASGVAWRGASVAFVTRGAQAVAESEAVSATHAPLWGFARSAALEHPELKCRRIDCDPARQVDVTALLDELTGLESDDETGLRHGARYVGRLVRAPLPAAAAGGAAIEPVRLALAKPGVLDSLTLKKAPRRAPDNGEVEVRVSYAGMNFKDVLIALGTLPGDPDALGLECSGTVVRTGPGITDIALGDEVIVVAPAAFAGYLTTDVRFVMRKPAALDAADAATLPAAFLTAYFALIHTAGLRRGERVLIHAGTGGVGMAAVQIAQHLGAEVFATAGTVEKRRWLENSGVRHVMSSRDPGFADAIARDTDGCGVDVVLNSLTGSLMSASLSALSADGRFIEIGKSGVLSGEEFRALRPRGLYAALDVGEAVRRDPALLRPMLAWVLERVERGELAPLPKQLFPASAATQAFRTMAQARHLGKLLLDFSTTHQHPHQAPVVRPQRTYLVTGAFGGLGLLVARLLVARGATSLVLTARHAPSADITAVLDGLRRSGVDIVVRQGNIADPDETAALLRQIASGPFPLAGIVHAAGVVDDGVLLHQDWGRFTHVMAAKVHGAWNLHQMTRDLPLDFFVMFSSVAALMGSAGQANHAAANAFMDALASCRRGDGLPALSINWGAWGEVGAAVTLGVGQRLAHKGIHGLRSDDGIEILERLLFAEQSGGQLPAQVGVMAVAWPVFMSQATNRGSARLSDFATVIDETLPDRPAVQASLSAVDIRTLQQMPPADRRSALGRAIATRLAHSLGLDGSAPIEDDRPFVDFGLDSLLAVELRGLLGSALAVTLPATIMFDYPTIESLADYLGREVLRIEPWLAPGNLAVATQAAAAGNNDALSSIEEMSDEEVERVLTGRLSGEAN